MFLTRRLLRLRRSSTTQLPARGEVSGADCGAPPDLRDYTVIGDQVNLGARVEALTRDYGCHIIITESTLNEIRSLADARLLGEETVKGKTKPIKVYELVGLKEA